MKIPGTLIQVKRYYRVLFIYYYPVSPLSHHRVVTRGIFSLMQQSGVSSQATIKSIPSEVDIMIIEWLPLEYALNMAKALLIPEQVAVQYSAFDMKDICDILYKDFYDLQPSSFKFLLKNKSFQIRATSYEKTTAAIRTLDLDFVKKYIDQVKPDLS
jgi:hypothetical protein